MGFLQNIINGFIDGYKSEQQEEIKADDKMSFSNVLEKANELINDDLYDDALGLLEKAKDSQLIISDFDFWLYYYKKAQFLYWKGSFLAQNINYSDENYDDCHNEKKSLERQSSLNLEQANKYVETKWQGCEILALRALVDYIPNRGGGRRYFIGALGIDDDEFKAEYLENTKQPLII